MMVVYVKCLRVKIQRFNENIDKIGCRLSTNEFDMYKYAEFYCKQDVNILRRAFNMFAADFQKEFNINPFNYVSISALANEVFNQKVYYPSGNMCKLCSDKSVC